jgi:hypothetical protein
MVMASEKSEGYELRAEHVFRRLFVLIFFLGCFLPGRAAAIFAQIPIEEVVARNPLIVVGELRRIEHSPRTPLYSYDTGYILVEKIIKNCGDNRLDKAGVEIPLAMPSVNNEMHVSTDIRYRVGYRGVWLLHQKDGKYLAD